MAFERAENVGRDVLGVLPMALIPFLQEADLGAADLHVQLHVFAQAGECEIRRADETERADDRRPPVGDVSLRVELILAIDAALDLARANRCDDGGHTGKEIILRFFRFETAVEALCDLFQTLRECALRPHRNLVSH